MQTTPLIIGAIFGAAVMWAACYWCTRSASRPAHLVRVLLRMRGGGPGEE